MNRATLGLVAALAVLAAFAMPARAADPVFPAGSRVGLVPPPGMVASDAFPGFEDPQKNAAILITTLPAAAYAQLEKSATAETMRKEGLKLEKREPMRLAVGKGFLVVGRQTADKMRFQKWILVAATRDFTVLVTVQVPEEDKTAYPDAAIRSALASLTVRASVPEQEQLGLLPFKVGDLAGFRVEGVMPGRALMLTDAPKQATAEDRVDTRLLVVAVPGGPTQAEDRENFARIAFGGIAEIKDVRITMSESLRLGGQQGHQMMAEAKDARTGADIMVVQWLRFGAAGFLHMIGIARREVWIEALTRMRTVRDSIEPR
jgi:hypothetical protein